MRFLKTHHHPRLLILLCALSATAGHAADTPDVLMQGAGVAITSAYAHTEFQTLPADARAKLAGSTEQMQQWLETLYLRKALSTQGERNQLAQKPAVQYQLQFTRESILANAQLQQVEDAALPPATALETQARTQYTAEKERFHRPEQIRASHILVPGADDTARDKAQQLRDQIKAGASFEDLARQHSADPGSAAKGGSLGWFSPGRMVPEFDAAIQQLRDSGDLSPVVKTQFGYHIIRLDERRPAQVQSFEEVRDQLIGATVQRLRVKAREAEFERLRELGKGDARALDAFMTRAQQDAPTQPQPAAQQ